MDGSSLFIIWASIRGTTRNSTHLEEPWKIARKGLAEFEASNELIQDGTISRYYTKVFEDGQHG